MDQTTDIPTFNGALMAFAALISDLGLECLAVHVPPVIDLLQSGLQGVLPCLEQHEFSIDLHESFGEAIGAIVAADASLFAPLLRPVLALAQDDDVNTKAFAISVLTDYATASSAPSEDFLRGLLQLALSVCADPGHTEGFAAIVGLVGVARDLVHEVLPSILQLITERLSPPRRQKSEHTHRIMEHCIACLGKLVIDIIGDDFPISDFVGRILPWMPATAEPSQNPLIMNFFMWIALRPGALEAYGVELCAVLVRLFGQSPADPAETGLDD
jgi:hypothetical protein